jgi:hypothetical protein
MSLFLLISLVLDRFICPSPNLNFPGGKIAPFFFFKKSNKFLINKKVNNFFDWEGNNKKESSQPPGK